MQKYKTQRMSRSWVIALLAAATPAELPPLLEASIPFGGIRDWQADRERGLWVQADSRAWYYGRFTGRCNGLNFATSIGFDTRFQSSFDRWSTVFVPGYGRCLFQSFTRSAGPPPRKQTVSAAMEATAKHAN